MYYFSWPNLALGKLLAFHETWKLQNLQHYHQYVMWKYVINCNKLVESEHTAFDEVTGV